MKKVLVLVLMITGFSFAEWCNLSEVEFVQPRKDGAVYVKLKNYSTWLKFYSSNPGGNMILSVALTALTTGQKVQFVTDDCLTFTELDWDYLRIVK